MVRRRSFCLAFSFTTATQLMSLVLLLPSFFTILFNEAPLVQALPFRTRGGGSSGDDEQEETVLVGSDGALMIEMRPRGSNRNAAVEAYFDEAPSDSSTVSIDLRDEIRKKAYNITDFLVSTRRTLHKQPELMYQEKNTSQVIQALLTEMGIEYTTGWAINKNPDIHPGTGGYGIVADIGKGEPCVLLRADMDALPILERTEGISEYISRNDNKMHACGHDGHTTMLLGAAYVLKAVEDSLIGTVVSVECSECCGSFYFNLISVLLSSD